MPTDYLLSEHPPGAATPQRPSPTKDDGPSLSHVLAMVLGLFKRYFWIFIITCAIGTTAAYFYTKQQPRIYQSTAKFMFQETGENIFGSGIERVDIVDPGGRYHFDKFWNTQQEVLRSRDFAERVVRRGQLLSREGFVPTERGGDPLSEERRLEIAASRVLGATSIQLKPGTQVVQVTSKTTDPVLARDLANAYVGAYIDYNRELQSGGLSQMVSWFDSYVSGKRKELNEALRKLHTFKRDNRILSISYEDRQSLTGTNMQAINSQLNQVKAKLASEEALLTQIEKMEKGGEDLRVLVSLIEGGEGLNSAIQREAKLQEKIAQLRGRGYLAEHPDIRALTSELEVVQKNIADEIKRIKSGARNRAETLRREQSRLNAELNRLKTEAFELDALGLKYNQLKDNSENLKELFQTVLKRSEELDINSMYESDKVRMLEEAQKPGGPVSPNMPVNLAIGFALGLGLGAGILGLIYALDNTVRSESDIARYTDRPLLGALPAVDGSVLKGIADIEGNPLDLVTHVAPKSSFAEGIKSLRTNLMFMAPDDPPKLLLVTSPGPSEGKTLICTNMAVAMAQSGMKTVIIDSDMRRPRVHKAFGRENRGEGLSSLITGESSLDEAVQETEVENLSLITCGPIPPNPSELLHTERFQALIEELDERFDRVLFDSPPLGAVSDALVLSHSVEGVLLVTRFGQTRKELLRRSIEQLETVGAPFMGAVLNNIDTSAGAYGYSYYSYYRYNYDERPDPKRRRAPREDAA